MRSINSKLFLVVACFVFSLPAVRAADGDIDMTYGTNGMVVRAGFSSAVDIAIQANDKSLVLAAYGDDFAVLRHNADGSLDTNFGSNGLAIVAFESLSSGETQDTPYTILLQPNGKILVAGSTEEITPGRHYSDFALARLNAEGTLDNTFGTNGIVVTDFSHSDDIAYDLAILPNGKILAVGQATKGNKVKFGIARYLNDGTLDANFAAGGTKSFGFGGGYSIAYGVALQDDGNIVITGRADLDDGTGTLRPQSALARLHPRGKFDLSFGTNGKVTSAYVYNNTVLDSWAGRPAIQTDGKIVVTGFYSIGRYFGIARYNSDGSPDAAFGSGGKALLIGYSGAGINRRVALDGNNIISGGWAYALYGYCNPEIVLFRFDSSGIADPAFGGGDGVVTYNPFLAFNCPLGISAESFALQSDGKLVTAGYSDDGITSGLTLARFYN
jgi:uncharacterized delta-60 repeat protein